MLVAWAVFVSVSLSSSPAEGSFVGSGSGRIYRVTGATYTASGGASQSSGQDGTILYEFRVEREDKCAFDDPTWGGCVPGRVDTCKLRNQNPEDDWATSNVWRRRVGAVAWGAPLTPNGECLNYAVIDPKPQISPEMVRQQVQKLLPKGVWHHQPPSGDTLVHMPVIFSVVTPQDEAFRPFPLLGQQVTARAHVRTYRWRFGDGTSADYTWPGRDYTASMPCSRDGCAGYVQHPYERSGAVSVSPRLVWSVQFRVAGGDWQDIPGAMFTDGPAQQIRLTSARTVLVPGGG
jgi:hypothetical protein